MKGDIAYICMQFDNLDTSGLMRSLVACGLLASGAFLSAQERPNILIFLVDDMGLMDTSCPFLTDADGNPRRYPLNEWYRTPNMERLASQGIRFSTFYANSVSSPSRASIMTGQTSARHHTTNWINSESNNRDYYGPYEWNWEGLRKEDMTLPRLLARQGYKTIHVGKAHFGSQGSEGEFPQNIGFEVNIAGSSIGQPGSYYGENGYGFIKGYRLRAVPGLQKYHGTSTFLTEALTMEANAQIDTAVAQKRPFFLYMAHYALHAPFERDSRFWSHYEDAGKSDAVKAFATLVEGMDKSLGDIMNHLEELGVAENTLIIFLGDNGSDAPLGPARSYSSSAPLRGKKGSEFEGGMRVPFIAAWGRTDPDNKFQKALPIAENAVQLQFGTVMDIYPTLARLAGAAVPAGHAVDGQDLSILLSGRQDGHRKNTFLMHFPHTHRGSYFTVYRKDDWKLVYYYNPGHPERPDCVLYNLREDPEEHREVSGIYPQKTIELLEEMAASLKEQGAQYPVDFEGTPVLPDCAYWKENFRFASQR